MLSLFLVDDLGWSDVCCYGSRLYETPAIDQLAKEGMLFDNAYSTCHVCSPSRASILTGKYPVRTNLTEWLGGRPERDYEKLHHGEKLTALPDSKQTLAETLHKHGYATANYGKAHLNKDPMTYGFDEAITGWVRSYYHPFSPAYEKTLAAQKGDYYTDKLADAAIDFIERNKERPFFVHLEHFSVHDPIQGRKDLVQKYEKKLATVPHQEGPDYILEPNPDGPAISGDILKALAENDSSTLHQYDRVCWVQAINPVSRLTRKPLTLQFRSCESVSQLKLRVGRRANVTPDPFLPTLLFHTLRAPPAPWIIRFSALLVVLSPVRNTHYLSFTIPWIGRLFRLIEVHRSWLLRRQFSRINCTSIPNRM